MKNSFSEKCSKKLCATMPYKRRSQFSGHFLSPDFGPFHTERDFFNSHRMLRQLTLLAESKSLRYAVLLIALRATEAAWPDIRDCPHISK